MYWHDGMYGWGWMMMGLSMVVFWGLIITAIVLLVRYTSGNRASIPPTGAASTARQLLAERYARGEVDEDEYRTRLAVLDGK